MWPALLPVALLVTAPGVALGQDAAPMALVALEKAAVGSWAEYQVRVPGEEPLRQRYVLVGRTADQLAVDVEMSAPEGRSVVTTVFRRADGKALSSVYRGADGKAESVEAAQLAAVSLLRPGDPSDGGERVTLQGRSWECRRYAGRGKAGTLTYWMSDLAAPTGLVRLRDTSGVEITLQSLGAPAKK